MPTRCATNPRERASQVGGEVAQGNDLDAFLLDPGRPWDGGPFSQDEHRLAAARAADLARLAAGFDHLAGVTTPARADRVITHVFTGRNRPAIANRHLRIPGVRTRWPGVRSNR